MTWGSGPVTGSVSWTYDSDFRVATEAVNGATAVSYAYDADSLVTQAGALSLTRDPVTGVVTGTTLGLVADTRSVTTFGEVASYRATATGAPGLEIQYTRDRLGRIMQKAETVEGVTTTTAYRYDPAWRLDQVTTNGIVTASYGYDANGNRVSRTTASGTETGTYDAQDRLLSYGGATYTYTANGELATKTDAAGTTTYQYDVRGHLLAVVRPTGTRLDYVIDGRSRRIGKTVNGVLVQGWLYRGGLTPVAELDGAGNLVARFVYGSNPLVPDYVVKGTATYRILTDHLGSPRLVVDTATGVVIQRRDYDAWDGVTLDTNPGFQPFGFAGGLEDSDTGLVRFGARDYDPETGRWTSKDPVGFHGGWNHFLYTDAEPVNRRDPRGLRTRGLGVTLSIGFIGVDGIQGMVAWDDYGNIGWVDSRLDEGISLGATAAVTGTYSCTNADLIYDLRGESVQTGVAVVYPPDSNWSWGIEDVRFNDEGLGGRLYKGVDYNVGWGTGTPVEVHSILARSQVSGFNVYSLAQRIRERLFGPAQMPLGRRPQ